MDMQSLIDALDPQELTYEATSLFAWEMGAVSDIDGIAQFMCRGGPYPPQASAKMKIGEDRRPEKKYWDFVKKEMYIFLCVDDKRYRELWKQIHAMQKKSTTAIVGVIATFLGSTIGAPATLLTGFVSVCLYAVIKLGKEAYCGYARQSGA